MKDKIKVLVYADSPAVATGFGQVVRGVFTELANTGRYDIDIFGINDRGGWKDPEEYPFKIYPAMVPGSVDFYGRSRFISVLRGVDLDIRPSWDIVFVLQDPFILEDKLVGYGEGTMRMITDLSKVYRDKVTPDKWFKTVAYWPIDSVVKENWVEDAIALPDRSVAYTMYGKEEIEKANENLSQPLDLKLRVIPHGVNVDDFRPLPKKDLHKFRRQFFQGRVGDDVFLVMSVARNQMRKDIPRTMMIFKEFQKRRPESYLYVHAKNVDSWGNLSEYARSFNLAHSDEWTYPGNFSENTGYPASFLNKLYNISDVHMLTTLGEGWGLPITEAMATKTLNICPNNTSIPELFETPSDNKKIEDSNKLWKTKSRGIPVKSYSTSSEWATYGPTDYERVRPLTNVDDAIEKLIWAYDYPDRVKDITERAYNWVKELSWKNVAKQWDDLFLEVYDELRRERKKGTKANESRKDSPKSDKPKQTEPERDVAQPVSKA